MNFFSGSNRFMNTCDVTGYADDLTVGAIIGGQIGVLVIKEFLCHTHTHAGVVLGHNITHTTAFDYDHVDLRGLNATAIAKAVS